MRHLQKQATFLPSACFLSTYQKSIKILCFSREKDTQDPAQGAITHGFLMPEVSRDEAGHCPKPEPEKLFCGETLWEEGPMPFISQFYLPSPPQKQSREERMLRCRRERLCRHLWLECWLSCGEKSLLQEAPGILSLCRLAGINPTAHDSNSHRWDTRHQGHQI